MNSNWISFLFTLVHDSGLLFPTLKLVFIIGDKDDTKQSFCPHTGGLMIPNFGQNFQWDPNDNLSIYMKSEN